MEQDFYKNRLLEQGISVITPDATQRKIVHDIIYIAFSVPLFDTTIIHADAAVDFALAQE
ncbi:hypothetical protein BFG52_00300 [Acinetobacter larvae]|uniref:Uncharacterized protein n=1 Tax=Acinetobacter larvae TaxID=1789224 RepID=A0A1B2LVI4_9GAMM|nr:hypothetical protein BFG52_00300 [Acinetobacter larvae]